MRMINITSVIAALLLIGIEALGGYGGPDLRPRPRTSASPAPIGSIAVTGVTAFNGGSGSYVQMPGTSVTLTTMGRPVNVGFFGCGGWIGLDGADSAGGMTAQIQIFRDGTIIPVMAPTGNFPLVFKPVSGTSSDAIVKLPASSLNVMDFPSAGNHTYTALYEVIGTGSPLMTISACFGAFEL